MRRNAGPVLASGPSFGGPASDSQVSADAGSAAPTPPPPRSRGASYLRACRDPEVWRRTLALGLPVGFLQAGLNQGDHWLRHDITAAVVTKSILSPLLSCSIAFVSAAATSAAKTLKNTSP